MRKSVAIQNKEIDEWIQEFDIDGDKRISFDEFK